jgi:hypothetical protein
MKYRIWKNKPWRDKIWHWRLSSPEFPDRYNLREAIIYLRTRKNDGAYCIIMPSFKE